MSTHDVIGEKTYAKPADEFTEMLEGMTKPELVKYARMTYNLSVNAKYNKPELIEAIRDSARKFKLNASFQTGASIATNGLRPGYSEIQLHRTELTKGLRTAIVGLNGTMASLPIGSKFGCPNELVAVLNDAVRIEYEKNPDTDELEERQVHSYPFTVFASQPHTPESQAKASRERGFKGRPPREFWDENYAARLQAQREEELYHSQNDE
jgi:hypothetical protein